MPRRRARWKRVLAWVAGVLAALVLLLVIAVAVLLHSPRVHQYVLRVAQQKATAALGSNVSVQEYGLHFSGISPSLDLYGVVVEGAAPYATPPLLQVQHAQVVVQVTSLLRRTWYLQDAILDHPVARVFVDQHGNDNLPQTGSNNQNQSKTSLFDLGIRHAHLNAGEVYYNNRKSALDADLHEVNFQAAFDAAHRSYSGSLSYRNGHLQMENFSPMEHDLDAQFIYSPDAFTLQRAVLRSGPSQIVLNAVLNDYDHPKVQAEYQATIDAGQFRRIMRNPTLPQGVILANGKLDYVSQPDVPLLQTVRVNGDLSSNALRVSLPSFRGDITRIAARYSLADGNADVRDLRAHLLGGELTGALTMRDIIGRSRSHLTAGLRGVSLAELKSLVTAPALQQVALSGAVNADADATWGKTMNDLVARTNATIGAQVAPVNGNAGAVPLNGVIHARYSAATRQIALSDSFVRTPQTSVTLNGTVSDHSSLAVRMQANDLHELETVAAMFGTPGQAAQPLGLYGTALFVGNVTGSTVAPHVTGQMQASNLQVRGTAWRLLRTNVDLSPSLAKLQNGELDPVPRGRVTFNLSAGLRKWSFNSSTPIQASLHASQLNLADLARAAGSQTPVSGTLAADVDVHGSQLNPVGQGTINLTQAKISGEPIQAVNVKFNGTGDAVHANLAVRLPAGTAQGVATYFPRQQGYEMQLQAKGIQLGQLQTVKARNLQLAGVLNLVASGRGTLQNPGLDASLQIPRLDINKQTISGLSLHTNVANHVANVALDSSLVNTQVHGRGTINLTGEYQSDITLDTQVIPLAPLVAAYAPTQAGKVAGQTELHATVHGPLKNKALLNAHVVIPQLSINYQNTVQIGEVTPIQIDYSNGELRVQRAELRGTGTDLQLQGTIPVVNRAAPVSLLLLGTMDLRLAQLIDPDITSSGQLRFNINSYGQRSDPNVQGQINVVNATFASGDIPIGLQNGNGVLTLTKDRLDITQFHGTVGGGDVSASGGVIYKPALRFDLVLAGTGVRMLYNNVRTAVDTNLTLTGSTDAAQLGGQVRVEQLQFTPGFDLMDFMGQLGGGPTVPPPTGGFSQALQLNVGVASTSGINLVSRTLSLQGAANLRVTGTAAQPVILGRVNLTGGDLIFNGNRYLLENGTLDFVNPTQTLPVVNVSVSTTIQQYDIRMHFWGPADQMHTNYASDPALPPSDIINLLAGFKTAEASAANPSPPGNLAAEQALASQVAGQVTSRVEKIAGISQLSIDPVLGSNTGQTPGARITVQQRVTSKIFVTFQTDVTSTQNDVIKLDYRQSRRLSFTGSRDQNGGFGFETRIHKEW